ncbi:hypothetical protein Daus18300_011359 [Diaporthe australafricana]|uniref:J domain-containing protein n=1 Tax=Diaporthe australafricana TaxID=127596 RepID=A0ABR3W6P8_9PEZI
MVGSNIARVMTLEELFARPIPRDVIKEPMHEETYYDRLSVDPLVMEKDLHRQKKKMALEMHPDKIGHTDAAKEAWFEVTTAFDTLLDGRRRCEYDDAKRIKGLWRKKGQTCYDAFREEYRQEVRDRIQKEKEVMRPVIKPAEPARQPPNKSKEAAMAMGSAIVDSWAYIRARVALYSATVISFVSWA